MPKYNVNFSDSAYRTLSELAEQLDLTMAEVVREALNTYWWVARELLKGNKVLVDRGGVTSEIVFPSFERIVEQAASSAGPQPAATAAAAPTAAGEPAARRGSGSSGGQARSRSRAHSAIGFRVAGPAAPGADGDDARAS